MYRGQLSLLDEVPATNLAPNYNIAPTHKVPVCRTVDGKRTLEPLHWGLLPFWAKDAKRAGSMINARSETLEEKRSFSPLLKSHRCVVPVSGFYEWKREGKTKQAYAIRRNDNPLMLLAGLWTQNSQLNTTSYTILTTSPNAVMAEIHDRMPVILSPDDVEMWLDGEWDDAKVLAKPSEAKILETWMVNNEVGKVANNFPELLDPVLEQNTLI